MLTGKTWSEPRNVNVNTPPSKPVKLAIINAALVHEHAQARWRMLSERYPVDVSLLIPNKWEQFNVWNTHQSWRPKELHQGRFHVIPLPTRSVRADWYFPSLFGVMRELRPDLVYVIQNEMAWTLSHTILCRDLLRARTKIMFFTMHALGIKLPRLYHKLRWLYNRRGVAAALCHYPGCMQSLRNGGFNKPVFLQTQVGVDQSVFFPDESLGQACRAELGIGDGTFVVGCVARLTEEKGIMDLLAALPIPGTDWKLLVLGEGVLREQFRDLARARGIGDRVIMTGLVPPNEVAKFLRAMDCLVHVPHTTSHWIETFSLAVAQAMATQRPVIGSDTGSVPWQVRDCGIIVKERAPEEVHRALVSLGTDRKLREHLGALAYRRATANFCISAMTDNFYSIMKQVLSNDFGASGDSDAQAHAHLA